MKNILTTVAAATLFTGLAISSVTAKSILSFDGNRSLTVNEQNISIDIDGSGVEVNMTLIPTFTFQGASFDLEFTNGGIASGTTVNLCALDTNTSGNGNFGWTKVGALQGSGTPVDNIMVNPKFSFIDDAATALLIPKDANITFQTGPCADLKALTIVGTGKDACKTITAKITNPQSTQAQALPDLETEPATIGTTAQFIKISCTAPECFVTSNQLKFTEDNTTLPGVNVALTKAISAGPNHSVTTAECPKCDETTDITSNCTTTITIANTAASTHELNVTKLSIMANFVGTGSLNTTMTLDVDGNGTATAYTPGSKITKAIVLAGGDERNITVTLKADGVTLIGLGEIQATIDGLETNLTKAVKSEFTAKNITTIKQGAKTNFTVPYMSANGAAKNSFVKISTLVGDDSTSLTATISDPTGTTCDVELTDVPKNGGSTYIFASAVPASSNSQALIPAGQCANLSQTDKLYSVVFHAGASVNAVGYMRTKQGERTIDIF